MARPTVLGIRYARLAAPVREAWLQEGRKNLMRSLDTFETRVGMNPFAGDPVKKPKWPKSLLTDYGDVPNLFRFELAERWRGYYALIGEPGGVRIHVLYLWDHATYSKASGYRKK